MAFIHASASFRERTEEVLSADNARPERHIVIDTLRKAASLMGLKAPVIATLDAMMSCLPPTRRHDTVFASNATLAFRRNGISDRTIRRHVVILQELGLLIRRDSPNRKRFVRHNKTEGTALRFGFDLRPLYEKFPQIAALAAEAQREQEQIAYLRTKLRALASHILRRDPENNLATEVLRSLRRKLTRKDCNALLTSLETTAIAAEQPGDPDDARAHHMSGNDGQNVRHHQNSKKDNTDKKETEAASSDPQSAPPRPLSVQEIVEACPEAAQFSPNPVKTMRDVVTHARTIAPMIGIDRRTYEDASERLGEEGTAVTVWAIMQFHDRIRKVGAYFRSITCGKKSAGFVPDQLVRRLGRSAERTARSSLALDSQGCV